VEHRNGANVGNVDGSHPDNCSRYSLHFNSLVNAKYNKYR
jgi:hypothetical protein